MWKLELTPGINNGKRVYSNDSGSKCVQSLCYKDKEGNDWYSFDDLLTLPYTRNFAATKVTSLYTLGLSKDDLTSFIDNMKAILQSNDREKYEKAYAGLLDFESKATNATNAIKQMTALVCVYFTIDGEAIDAFDGSLQSRKMALIEADPEMHAFFLNRQMQITEDYMTRLQLLSQTVLPNKSESS